MSEGEPLRLRAVDLSPATCWECRGQVWILPAGTDQCGDPLVFDLIRYQGQDLLSLHPCCYDLSPEDIEEPDPEDHDDTTRRRPQVI